MTAGDLQASSKVRQGLEQVLAEAICLDMHPTRWSERFQLGPCAACIRAAVTSRAWFAALLDESRDDIAQACGDPGSFVKRREDESLSRWSGRAVDAAIKQRAGMSS